MRDEVNNKLNTVSEVYHCVLLKLNIKTFVYLNTSGMYSSAISSEESPLLTYEHKLAFPHLFLVGNLQLVWVAFTYPKNLIFSIKNCLYSLFWLFQLDL